MFMDDFIRGPGCVVHIRGWHCQGQLDRAPTGTFVRISNFNRSLVAFPFCCLAVSLSPFGACSSLSLSTWPFVLTFANLQNSCNGKRAKSPTTYQFGSIHSFFYKVQTVS